VTGYEWIAYGGVDEGSLVDVDANEVVEPGLCTRNGITAKGGQLHEALHRIGVCDLLVVAQGKPFLADSCVATVAAPV
jgi:hypothetical protein